MVGVTDRDRLGRTAVHYVAADGDADGLRVLLAGGAAAGVADDAGWTPLHFAAQAQAPPVVEVLLAAGAAVDAVDRHGNTPLWGRCSVRRERLRRSGCSWRPAPTLTGTTAGSCRPALLAKLLRRRSSGPWSPQVCPAWPWTVCRPKPNSPVRRDAGGALSGAICATASCETSHRFALE
ncbi:ankyrin repeat domain-containing protein [Streptomyces echinatus]|uniref:ankyrin repeat domain-containing protein n=1 Tax=Streptomyces echinatus TaxID=67293 RepID=UPI0038245904